ncbi:MAG: hypothetical protein U9P37_01125 [Pseudomonadota bacterium]|nr:hypothetical protein [Pseudomonadota bacterium]
MKIGSFCRSLLLAVVLLFALQATCLAVNHIDATFEGIVSYTHYEPSEFVPGQVVPTEDDCTDRPCYLGKPDGFIVENNGTVTGPTLMTGNFMRIQDTDDYAAHGAHFDFYDRAFNSGCVRVSWDVLFESYEEYYFRFRNGKGDDFPHPAKSKVADIYTWSDGSMTFESGGSRVLTTTYETGILIHFDCYFDLDGNQWAVVVNGEVLFNNAVIDNYPLGLFIPGYLHDANLTGAMQVDNIQMYPADSCDWPEMNAQCPSGLPDPQLSLTGTQNVMIDGVQRLQYQLSVTNYNAYPESLFTPSPGLPPCGLNTNSSRTWVDIYDQDDQRVYGFCALGTPGNLNNLWFDAATAPATMTAVRVKFDDRLCDQEYQSNLVSVTPDMLATLTLTVRGSGIVRTSDRFDCGPGASIASETCTLTYLKGQTITLTPVPVDGDNYTSSFAQWSGGNCSGTEDCTMTITDDVTVEAQFAALGTPVYNGAPLPAPAGQDAWNYPRAIGPVKQADPAACNPFASGKVSSGEVKLQIGLPPFSEAVDIYVGIQYVPLNTEKTFFYMVDANNDLQLPDNVLPAWKTKVTSAFNDVLLWDTTFRRADLPPGTYYLYIAVTPADNYFERYYLWATSFIAAR